MVPSARSHIAGESKRSRWDQARVEPGRADRRHRCRRHRLRHRRGADLGAARRRSLLQYRAATGPAGHRRSRPARAAPLARRRRDAATPPPRFATATTPNGSTGTSGRGWKNTSTATSRRSSTPTTTSIYSHALDPADAGADDLMRAACAEPRSSARPPERRRQVTRSRCSTARIRRSRAAARC